MKEDVLFSIVMCVYNRPLDVVNAVQSVVQQTYGKWELLVVDDCSTDDTPDVLRSLQAADARINVMRMQENGGPAAARNLALEHCRGQYICFLDSDDKLDVKALEILADYCQSRPDLVVFDYVNCRNEAEFAQNRGKKDKACYYESAEIQDKVLPQYLDVIPHDEAYGMPFLCNKAFKAELMNRHNLRLDGEKRMWEDGEFTAKFIAECSSLVRINSLLLKINAIRDGKRGHSSSGYTWNMAPKFLEQYEYYLSRWGQTYNFFSDIALQNYLDAFLNIMQKAVLRDKAKYRSTLSYLLSSERVKQIILRKKALGFKEKMLKFLISRNRIQAAGLFIALYAKMKQTVAGFR